MRAQLTNTSVVDVFAKEFAKFLNRVQNQHADMLGSFLIDSEWEKYKPDASTVVKSFELSGYAIAPRDPAEAMIGKADSSFQANLYRGTVMRQFAAPVTLPI
ncbi:MAG: hypothetical protein FJX60_16240 [Alphaproteobacteria bacterium]|nr:hypothetical protein [Alphaproteobacteria bacterium]